MGRIPQLIQHMPAPVGIRPRGSFVPWFRAGGAPQPIGAYQPKSSTAPGGYSVASIAESYINRANPGTYDAAPGVAPVWDAVNGWTGDGATTYLETGIVHDQGWTIIVQFTGGATQATDGICGANEGTDQRLAIWTRFDAVGANRVVYGGGSFLGVVPQLAAGNLCVAGQQGYRNGVADGGAIGAWVGVNTRAITLCASREAAIVTYFSAASIQAVAIYNTTLTAPQVLAVATAMAAL